METSKIFILLSSVRKALCGRVRWQRRRNCEREVDAQDERSSAAEDHGREVHDRDRKVLQRRVRAGPAGALSLTF